MATDYDDKVLKELSQQIQELSDKYWALEDEGDRFLVRPQLEELYRREALARARLLEPDQVTNQTVLDQLTAIRDDIHQAATAQAIIIAIARLIAFLAVL